METRGIDSVELARVVRPVDPAYKKAPLQAAQAVLGLFSSGAQEATVHPVVFGVLTQAFAITGWPDSLIVVVAANELTTDLSGLEVVEDERFEALLDQLEPIRELMGQVVLRSPFP